MFLPVATSFMCHTKDGAIKDELVSAVFVGLEDLDVNDTEDKI
jgi:hypothetical protein